MAASTYSVGTFPFPGSCRNNSHERSVAASLAPSPTLWRWRFDSILHIFLTALHTRASRPALFNIDTFDVRQHLCPYPSSCRNLPRSLILCSHIQVHIITHSLSEPLPPQETSNAEVVLHRERSFHGELSLTAWSCPAMRSA